VKVVIFIIRIWFGWGEKTRTGKKQFTALVTTEFEKISFYKGLNGKVPLIER
jgi:hypothetical protein